MGLKCLGMHSPYQLPHVPWTIELLQGPEPIAAQAIKPIAQMNLKCNLSSTENNRAKL